MSRKLPEKIWEQIKKSIDCDPPILYVIQFYDPTECLTDAGRPLAGIHEMVVYTFAGAITDIDEKSVTIYTRWQESKKGIVACREQKMTLLKNSICYLAEMRMHKKWIDDRERLEEE